MASHLLKNLCTKSEVDRVIKQTEDLVLVLRFGRDDDMNCLVLDDILAKTEEELRNMASIYTVDVDHVAVYRQYFDITLIPATIFFFNGQHMKVDWGCGLDPARTNNNYRKSHLLFDRMKRITTECFGDTVDTDSLLHRMAHLQGL